MPVVTAIIPAWNRQDLTVASVLRLARQTRPPDRILVVDDGSTDQTEFLARHVGAEVLRHPRNRGFAAAVNTGIRASDDGLLAILNNDVTLQPDWLEQLVSVLIEPSHQFAIGKLYRPDGLLDGAWDTLCRGGLAWRAGAGRPDGPDWSTPRSITLTSFTAVVVRKTLFDEIGLLDESYGSYYEDIEWSFRAALAGRKGYFLPAAHGEHEGSATSRKWSRFSTRQLLLNHRRFAMQYLLPEYRREYDIARNLFRALCLSRGVWPYIPEEPVEPRPRPASLAATLAGLEQELFALQQLSGFDTLWRLYFRLAGSPA